MRRPIPQPLPKTGDEAVDRALRQIHEQVAALSQQPLAGARFFYNVQLADGQPYQLAHGLGQPLTSFMHGDLRGPATSGRIERVIQDVDSSKHLVLLATGYGATVTVTIAVW